MAHLYAHDDELFSCLGEQTKILKNRALNCGFF